MQAVHVPGADLDALLDPNAATWSKTTTTTLALMGTPVGLQPTGAIQAAWMGKKIGAVAQVSVAAIHNGTNLAFRLEWPSATESRTPKDNDEFSDAAAILLPVVKDAPLMTMGAPSLPVNAWYWRGDDEKGRHVVAEGIGTSRTVDVTTVRTQGQWKDGRWRVVITRAMQVESTEPTAALAPGQATGFGVAIWEGASGERAGIKAFSGDWQPLQIDSL